jgi:hypothetical protein
MPESALKSESSALETPAQRPATSSMAVSNVWASLQATFAAIREDSASAPTKYLEDTVVPYGGE